MNMLKTCLLPLFLLLAYNQAAAAEAGSGEMEPALTRAQAAIVPIAAFTAMGDEEKLGKALAAGLEAGLGVNEIREILIQMYAYAGFPRSLTALDEFRKLLETRKAGGINDKLGPEPKDIPASADKFAIGEKIQTHLVGRPVAGPIYDFAPAIGVFLKEHLFCDIFARNVLDEKDRELATVAALAALPAPRQLASHIRVCRNIGITLAQLRDCARILDEKVGARQGSLFNETLAGLYPDGK